MTGLKWTEVLELIATSIKVFEGVAWNGQRASDKWTGNCKVGGLQSGGFEGGKEVFVSQNQRLISSK
jgi:hypothetical protein